MSFPFPPGFFLGPHMAFKGGGGRKIWGSNKREGFGLKGAKQFRYPVHFFLTLLSPEEANYLRQDFFRSPPYSRTAILFISRGDHFRPRLLQLRLRPQHRLQLRCTGILHFAIRHLPGLTGKKKKNNKTGFFLRVSY